MSVIDYQDALTVWEALHTISHSATLQNVITHRFAIEGERAPTLSVEGDALLEALNADQLIRLEMIQTSVLEYHRAERQRDESQQKLAAINARRRTLEMRARNVEQEQSRGGLFRGKRQQELIAESQKLSDALLRAHNEAGDLEDQLQLIERYRAEISEQLSRDPNLQDARWVKCSGERAGVVLVLTAEGRFLFDYLSEMRREVLSGRPLSHVLVYGVAWSMSS